MKKLKLNRQHIQNRDPRQELYLPDSLYKVLLDTWASAAIFDKKTITVLTGAPPAGEPGWVEIVINTPLTPEAVSAVRYHSMGPSLVQDAYTLRPWLAGRAVMDPDKARRIKLCRYGVNAALGVSAFSGLSMWVKVEGGWEAPEPVNKPKFQAIVRR